MTRPHMKNIFHTSYVLAVVRNCQIQTEGFKTVGDLSQVRFKYKIMDLMLKYYSLSICSSFSDFNCLEYLAPILYLYSIFTFEILQNLFLEVSKLLNHGMFPYLPSQTVMTKTNGLQTVSHMPELQNYYIIRNMKVDLNKHESS